VNKSVTQKNSKLSAELVTNKEDKSRQIQAWTEASKRERLWTAVACWLGSFTFAGPGQWLSGRTIRGILWFAGELVLISAWLLMAGKGSGWPLATATGAVVLYHLTGWVDAVRCGWRFHKVILESSVSRILVMASLVFAAPLPAATLVYELGRVWLVKEYKISEGSMAPALLGQHANLHCQACGYTFAVGLSPYPRDYSIPPELRCPMCGNHNFGRERAAFLSGDDILSSKRLAPGRWDLLLFRSPTDLETMILKRVVGLPGEELEIIDGEIFINSKLLSKPALAHEEMWLPVCDTKFQAKNTYQQRLWWKPAGKTDGWQRKEPSWGFNATENSQQSLELTGELTDQLIYNINSLQYIKPEPIHDVRLRMRLSELQGTGALSLVWEHAGTQVTGTFQAKGQVSLEIRRTGQDQPESVQRADLGRDIKANSMLMLVVRDGYAYLYLGREQLCQGAVGPFEANIARNNPPEACRVHITAANCRGKIARIRLDRDVHYRTVLPQPVKISTGHYYVLGDNSAISYDSRLGWQIYPGLMGWDEPTTVPAEFTEGVVTCVYWPLARVRSFR